MVYHLLICYSIILLAMQATDSLRFQSLRQTLDPHYEGLANKLAEKNIIITAKPETTSPWATLLYSWAPILLMIGF